MISRKGSSAGVHSRTLCDIRTTCNNLQLCTCPVSTSSGVLTAATQLPAGQCNKAVRASQYHRQGSSVATTVLPASTTTARAAELPPQGDVWGGVWRGQQHHSAASHRTAAPQVVRQPSCRRECTAVPLCATAPPAAYKSRCQQLLLCCCAALCHLLLLY
jgi:hypothetical protein